MAVRIDEQHADRRLLHQRIEVPRGSRLLLAASSDGTIHVLQEATMLDAADDLLEDRLELIFEVLVVVDRHDDRPGRSVGGEHRGRSHALELHARREHDEGLERRGLGQPLQGHRRIGAAGAEKQHLGAHPWVAGGISILA